MFENYPEIVTSKDVAKMINISYSTVRSKIISENQIPYRRIGSTYRFRKDDVINFLKGDKNDFK